MMKQLFMLAALLISLSGCLNFNNYTARDPVKEYVIQGSSLPLQAMWEFQAESSILSPVIVHEPYGIHLATTTTIYSINTISGELQWQYESSTLADAAPTTWGRYVYFLTDRGEAIIALDGSTGELVWSFEPASVVTANSGKPLIRFLTTDQQSLYVVVNLLRGTDIIRLDPQTGNVLAMTPPEFPRNQVSMLGFYVGPTWLVLRDSTDFWVFSKDLGQVIDYVNLSFESYRQPSYANATFYTSGQTVRAISLPDFTEKWQFEDTCIMPWDQTPESPFITENSVYINTTCGKVYKLEAETGKVIWQYQSDTTILALAFVGEVGYLLDAFANIVAISLENGQEIGGLTISPNRVTKLSPYQYLADGKNSLVVTYGNNQAFGFISK